MSELSLVMLDQVALPVTAIPVASELTTGELVRDQPISKSEIIRRGADALGQLLQAGGRDWPRWIAVMHALEVGRAEAMREAGCNAPKGQRYSAAFSKWLRLHPQFERIHKADRSRLFECLRNLEAITAWRNGLAPGLQIKYNYPPTVLSHWKRSLKMAANRSADPPAIDLKAAWAAASPDQRRDHLDDLGREGLCTAMSSELLEELSEHLLGQQIKTADASSDFAITLTRILRRAITETDPERKAFAFERLDAKLKSNNRTFHDFCVAVISATASDKGKKRKRY